MKNHISQSRQKYLLQQAKSRQQAFLDSNKAAIAFSASAIKSAILLNGMGAVAVLYSPQVRLAVLNCTLLMFAMGALLAVGANGFAYLAQYYVMLSWRHELFLPPSSSPPEIASANEFIRSKNHWARVWKFVAGFLLIFSWIFFLLGAFTGYSQLQQTLPG